MEIEKVARFEERLAGNHLGNGGHAIETVIWKTGTDPIELVQVMIGDQYNQAFKSQLQFSKLE